MKRRTFVASAALGPTLPSRAQESAAPSPFATLGKTGLRVCRVAVGGYHMLVNGEQEGLRILRRAFELGLNFYDSANHYHRGRSDELLGRAFSGPTASRSCS